VLGKIRQTGQTVLHAARTGRLLRRKGRSGTPSGSMREVGKRTSISRSHGFYGPPYPMVRPDGRRDVSVGPPGLTRARLWPASVFHNAGNSQNCLYGTRFEVFVKYS
jgi:hypothetical protein